MLTTTLDERQALGSRMPLVGYGADLLDEHDQPIGNLTEDLVGGTWSRNNYAAVHGACDIQLLRVLDWPTARIRLWQSINGHRWNVGVYLPTRPATPIGENPATLRVTGQDKLHLLQHYVGDTYVIPAGTGYLAAARQVLEHAGVTGLPPLFAGAAEAKVLAEPMVWALDLTTPTSWLRVVNDLLGKVGYRGLWVDGDGRYRSEPYQTPAVRPVEWAYDGRDGRTSIIGPGLTDTTDVFDPLNWWRFVRTDNPGEPTEGAGLYTVDRRTGGAVRYPKVVGLTAADQESLVAQGDQTVDTDTHATRRISMTCGPMPVLGHMDVTTLTHPSLGRLKLLAASWTQTLDGSEDTKIEQEVVTGG